MPIFNKLNKKLIDLYIKNKSLFSNEELEAVFMNMITFKSDGSRYSDGTINGRLTTLNKILIKDHEILVLNDRADAVIEAHKQHQEENPIEERKEEKKQEIDMKEVETIKTPYIQFLDDTEKYKNIFQDLSNRKARAGLIEMVNGAYTLLQLNSGVRINELLEREFAVKDSKVIYKQSKSSKNIRKFKPLFMEPRLWIDTLYKLRDIVGKENTTAVTKRLNIYLKKCFLTIKKTHDLRKIYVMLSKDSNPLSHKNTEMEKVYQVMKPSKDSEKKPTIDKEKVFCEVCNIGISKYGMARHLATKKHKQNL